MFIEGVHQDSIDREYRFDHLLAWMQLFAGSRGLNALDVTLRTMI